MSKILSVTMAMVVDDRDERAPDHRHDHAEEDLALVGAVESRRLVDLGGDALDGGRQDHHREAGLQPDRG